MNKQQLANNIWASANKMRSKIEANEYKDYILGFIFYKYLSDKEYRFLVSDGWTENDICTSLNEDNEEDRVYIQQSIGYFIPYKYLFKTWMGNLRNFGVGVVRDALSSFERNINKTHAKVFRGIFDTLETGLKKLGGTDSEQTNAIRKLLKLIKPIPTDDNQNYDVLGFVYEYLISNFAANAGKKAGEFYTPHEVALLMADIVADHLKDRNEIKIYDPTSGSGSLLINIGKAIAKYMPDRNNIKYYAQELKENTYNLTRMNLVMRDILPDNIVVRNGDTLEKDWPYFDETDDGTIIDGSYEMLDVDAVVSNPPYSQAWEPKGKESDPRFKNFGLAPKGKADYAFLLHSLYHTKKDGIVTIVLPHGVLFRGGDDGKIRSSLIEHNYIDAIISLPANIFFGTGIATIIMVLKKNRLDTDVLLIDASKNFEKSGKNNRLRASDIRRIADTVIHRTEIPKYSRRISREEIRRNDYNLNIARYIDSSEPAETWDIYASIFGDIPEKELDSLKDYWDAFPSLRKTLFAHVDNTQCSQLAVDNLRKAIDDNIDVDKWRQSLLLSFMDFPEWLDKQLIDGMLKLNIPQEEDMITKEIFSRIGQLPLVDRYGAYQIFSNFWAGQNNGKDEVDSISNDLEIIQSEGLDAIRQVDPNIVPVSNKKGDEDAEEQKGWKGHILPFDLVQRNILTDDYNHLLQTQEHLNHIEQQTVDLMDGLDEDDRESYLNDTNDAFDLKKVCNALDDALSDIESPELNTLKEYLHLLENKAKKNEKINFINAHREVNWTLIDANKDGTFGKGNVNKRINTIKASWQFPEGTTEAMLSKVLSLSEQEKNVKIDIKLQETELHLKTKKTIEQLTDEQVHLLLVKKWIEPLCDGLNGIPGQILNEMTSRLLAIVTKYDTCLVNIEKQLAESGNALSGMIDQIAGNNTDNKALAELKKIIKKG